MLKEKKRSIGDALDAVIDALEGLDDQARAITVRAACEHLGITPSSSDGGAGESSQQPSTQSQTPASAAPQPSKQPLIDIRALTEKKKPSSAIEMACVVAYYLENHAPAQDRQTEIKTKLIEKYFKQAGYHLPKVPGQVLVDAKAAGYFDSPGRGRYKLNPVGYNLVVHSLPRTKGKHS